ncbi:hypothetical protein K5X77_03420 [Vagococcus lutrae]|uniref:Uncharacterized protein n=1 Tax=Vagococcus lutrae TaxID=81947 RepID=A0AAE9XE32_9ENTE|nr:MULTISPECIES: hypothetical protein [Vagococcus]MCO7151603.1 hypothetical protein [Vagococcus lutrae]MDO5741638.1 hypothetical protein [Vagococcus sp.]MDT2802423.1 hypothetical protein [Vagococcus lutrae]MDT2808470.1 hypothetical protein [Vagococcus lutrae]MDT2812941.1 hypothetical protein [Vagococcus lutrae]
MDIQQVKRNIYRQYVNLKKGYEEIVKPELLNQEASEMSSVTSYDEDSYELTTQQRIKWRSKGY